MRLRLSERSFEMDEAIAGLCKAVRWVWSTGETNLLLTLNDLLERELLKHAMIELKGVKTQVARRVGMSKSHLYDRLKHHGLE